MEIDRTAMIGAGGLLVGALVTYAVGSSGRAALEAQLRQQEDLSAGLSSLETSIAELQGGLATLTATVDGNAAAGADGQAALAAQLDGLSVTLTQAIGGVGAEVSDALAGDIQSISDRLAALSERPAATDEAGGSAPPEPAAGPGAGETLAIATATTLADGALRVFLSAADAVAGTARVAVNGVVTSRLALDEPTEMGECSLTLTGFVPGGATIDAECGDAPAEAAEAPPAAPEGSGSAVGVGETVHLADGALRVFLSGADEASGTARVAINGVIPTVIALGEAVAVQDCALTLTGFEAGRAMVAGQCGGSQGGNTAAADGAGEGDGAASAEGGDSDGAGTAIATGAASSFADGAVRVFVSAVDTDAGTARIAVNGTALETLEVGGSIPAGDCTATLTGAEAGQAMIEVAC